MNDAELLLGVVLLRRSWNRQNAGGCNRDGRGEHSGVFRHGWRLQTELWRLTLGASPHEVISEKRDFYGSRVLSSEAEKRMQDRTVTFGRYRLEPGIGLTSGAREVHLTPKALGLLSYLAERPGDVITKEELFGAIWPEVAVGDAA